MPIVGLSRENTCVGNYIGTIYVLGAGAKVLVHPRLVLGGVAEEMHACDCHVMAGIVGAHRRGEDIVDFGRRGNDQITRDQMLAFPGVRHFQFEFGAVK